MPRWIKNDNFMQVKMSFDSVHLDFSRLYTIVNNYWHTLANHAGKAGFGIFLSAQQFFSSCTK